MPRLSDAQLEERAEGLGASDVAVAAGVSPFQTPFELYLSKIGELDLDATITDAQRGRMERGHRLEDVALEWDRDVTGDKFIRVTRTIRHPVLAFGFCHPDAARDRKLRHLIEVKTSSRAWTEVPPHVAVQVQWQMACTGAERVTILVQTFDGPPVRWEVERDPDLIHALEVLAAAFWDRVTRRDPPPVDGSSGASRWLDRHQRPALPERQANDAERTWIEQALVVREDLKRLEAEYDTLVNQLKFSMGSSGRLDASGARATWSAPWESRSTRWKGIAAVYRDHMEQFGFSAETLDAIEEEYTTREERTTFSINERGA